MVLGGRIIADRLQLLFALAGADAMVRPAWPAMGYPLSAGLGAGVPVLGSARGVPRVVLALLWRAPGAVIGGAGYSWSGCLAVCGVAAFAARIAGGRHAQLLGGLPRPAEGFH